jgi:RNA polymerase sigma-70 factor (ECF subfamily)
LVASVRRHDENAAATFHDRVLPRVEATILRVLGGRDRDHEDLVQLSLIELIRSIRRFRGDCSVDSWTAKITARVVYKYLRRRGTEARIFASTAPEPIAPGSGPASDAETRGLVERVRGHLGRIGPEKAWAFLLHDVCGYKLEEAAEIMNITRAAAQSRVVRGRRELHDLICSDPELADSIKERY